MDSSGGFGIHVRFIQCVCVWINVLVVKWCLGMGICFECVPWKGWHVYVKACKGVVKVACGSTTYLCVTAVNSWRSWQASRPLTFLRLGFKPFWLRQRYLCDLFDVFDWKLLKVRFYWFNTLFSCGKYFVSYILLSRSISYLALLYWCVICFIVFYCSVESEVNLLFINLMF